MRNEKKTNLLRQNHNFHELCTHNSNIYIKQIAREGKKLCAYIHNLSVLILKIKK